MKYNPEITIECLPEDQPIKRNCSASGDLEQDLKIENEIMEQLNNGNDWAWCVVKVTVEFRGLKNSEYLGACSYKNKEDFENCGYCKDMITEAIYGLNEKIANLQNVELVY